jgi:hypothetical protein
MCGKLFLCCVRGGLKNGFSVFKKIPTHWESNQGPSIETVLTIKLHVIYILIEEYIRFQEGSENDGWVVVEEVSGAAWCGGSHMEGEWNQENKIQI